MKTKLNFMSFAIVLLLTHASAYANTTIYRGEYRTSYSKWSGYQGGRELWPCKVIINETAGKVTARVQFEQINGHMDFAFDPTKMEHPASDESYLDVPVNFDARTYMNYSINTVDKFDLRLDYFKKNDIMYLVNVYLKNDQARINWHCDVRPK